MPLLQLEVEKDELFFVRKLLLKDMTKKLPVLARLYIWLKKKHIN